MEIEQLALLARLKLSRDEKDIYSEQMNSIIEYIHTLNKLDTSNIEPTSHVLPIKNVFREDKVRASLPRDKILLNAPERDQNFFKVQKIIE